MRKAKNNPKPTIDDRCIICGEPYAQTHEIFQGKNRQISIRYGFQVKLCNEHHLKVHSDINLSTSLKINAQEIYEIDHRREEWMALIGRNYI